MPDIADLRLLGEIINHGAVGLPQAAWNAGMSQSEAAARLVTMAERGMPLRLVAEGDRQQLWQIAQAGPVLPAPPVLSAPEMQPAATTGPLATVAAEPAGLLAEPETRADPEPSSIWGVPGTADWVRPPEQDHPVGSDPVGDNPVGGQFGRRRFGRRQVGR